MKIKLIPLPFHWVYPNAPEKYCGCTVSVPAFDPDAPERGERLIRAARVASFNAAVGSVRGKTYRAEKLPRTVLIPTTRLYLTRRDAGCGRRLVRIARMRFGFLRYQVEDLMTKPFANCTGLYVCKRTLKKLERIMAVTSAPDPQ